MPHLILFDTPAHRQWMRPFSFTRPLAAIRNGILTQGERWARHLGLEGWGSLSEDYLARCYPTNYAGGNCLLINAALVPTAEAFEAVENLQVGQYLVHNGEVLAISFAGGSPLEYPVDSGRLGQVEITWPFSTPPVLLDRPWKIYLQAKAMVEADFGLLTAGRRSEAVNDDNTIVYGRDNLFIEQGVKIRASILNAEDGPIYLGQGAQVQEGAIIHGTHAICEGATVNMAAKLRGDSIIGPHCKVGGEVANSVLFGYSNKGHDGYLGNSVLGKWCNLGADTNTSNLKNNYTNVAIKYAEGEEAIDTGQLFCGLLMGDHSKAGINTMFNTGTVAGVGCNLYGGGFMPKTIPNLAWGTPEGFENYRFDKFIETERRVMARRKKELTAEYEELLSQLTVR